MTRYVLMSSLLVAGLCLACEARRSDEAISQDFMRLAEAQPELAASDVRAISEDGQVTLRGFVHSEEARRSATNLAEEIAGVKQVRNELQVMPPAGEQPKDSEPMPGDSAPSPGVVPTPTPETERGIDDAR